MNKQLFFIIIIFLNKSIFGYTDSKSLNNGSIALCTSDKDCNVNGECDKVTRVCLCNNSYATYMSETSCNYKKKKTFDALMYAIFLPGTGAVFFYLEHYDLACINLFFGFGGLALNFLVALMIIPLAKFENDNNTDKNKKLFEIC